MAKSRKVPREGMDGGVWAALCAGGPFDSFPRHEGRVDLRKRLAIPPPIEKGPEGPPPVKYPIRDPSLRKVELEDIDFSGCTVRNLSTAQTSIRNWVFDKVDFRQWGMWSTRLSDCSFVGSRLTDGQFGALLPDGWQNRFERVRFKDCRMQYLDCAGAVFEDCVFEDINWYEASFGSSCTFRRCVFRGMINNVQFGMPVLVPDDQRRFLEPFPQGVFEDVDFSDATLIADFYDVRDQGIKWPDPSTHVVLPRYRSSIARLLEELPGLAVDESVSRFFRAYHEALREHEGIGVFHKPWLVEAFGERDAALLIPLLERLRG